MIKTIFIQRYQIHNYVKFPPKINMRKALLSFSICYLFVAQIIQTNLMKSLKILKG